MQTRRFALYATYSNVNARPDRETVLAELGRIGRNEFGGTRCPEHDHEPLHCSPGKLDGDCRRRHAHFNHESTALSKDIKNVLVVALVPETLLTIDQRSDFLSTHSAFPSRPFILIREPRLFVAFLGALEPL